MEPIVGLSTNVIGDFYSYNLLHENVDESVFAFSVKHNLFDMDTKGIHRSLSLDIPVMFGVDNENNMVWRFKTESDFLKLKVAL